MSNRFIPRSGKFVTKHLLIRGSLLTHVKTVHSKIKSFVCVQCYKKIAQSGNLTIKIRTHTNDKPYNCSFCDKNFATSSILLCHEFRNHTKQFPRCCTFCPKGFLTPGRL